ncbi:MAG: hypothetical protein IJ420_10050 [Lachnospiraceae bacterium]|nr:hypothetical protein [Lachnospiraceae bacterium]MBQ7864015.1 hypothetical protein [Lachnospiraceae bacterium]MBQ8633936.1 hypothetical protein [Lachnospiraceae bacterium]
MKDNIIRVKQKKDVNIGIVIFLVIMVYVLFHVYTFFTKSEIPLYEVQPGEMYVTSQCDGLILREEQLVYTEIAGYLNYYYGEGSRVSKNSTVYSIDSNRDMYDLLSGSATEIKLSGNDLADLKQLLYENLVYPDAERSVSERKAAVTTGYQRLIDAMLMEELNQIVTSTGILSNFHVVSTEQSGIISYMMDEYTDFTIQDVTASCFDKKNTASSLYSVDLIAANSPVYKIITGDSWRIVVLLNDTLYGHLLGKESATFYLDNKIKITAPISCYRKDNDFFAEITLDKYLSNYTAKRFVDINFELEYVDGLKIPESAVTFKDYYRIPEEYLVLGGNETSKTKGLLVEEFDKDTGTTKYTFKEANVFYSIDGFAYIDCLDFAKEIYISTPDMSSRVMLYTFVNKLEGAYNINKGYAVFKRVERLKTENGYVIVKKNSVSGLSAYDHIALDATTVVEGSVIY